MDRIDVAPGDGVGSSPPPRALAPAPPLRHRTLHGLARRALNPVVTGLGLAGARRSPIGLVIHVGRRSGRTHETPLAVHRRGDELLVPLTYGPGARWCLNVLAAGSCRVRLDGAEVMAARPRVVGREALPRYLGLAYRLVGMRDFLKLTVVGAVEGRSRPA